MSIVPLTPKMRISAEMFTALQKNLGETRRAVDAFSNPMARLGAGTNNLMEFTQYPLTRLSFNYILLQSLYRSNWVARKVVDSVAEDLTKNWIRLDTELPPKKLTSFDQVVRKTGVRNQLQKTIKWGRLFGGAAAVMMIDGHEEMLEEPLDIDDVELNSFKGLIPLDRWSGINPSGTLSTDIERPLEFGLPEYYTVHQMKGSSFKVHSSRVLRFIGPDLPVWEKQVEQYWGISVIEPMYDELKKFDNTSWNIASLIFRANILALKQKDLAQMLSGLGSNAQAQKNFYAVLQAQSSLMSNQGLLVLPEEGGMEQHSYSFGGLTDVYESFKENICGACGIPYSRLFGRPPGGLATTNEGDEHAYYENMSSQQNRDLDPQMQKLVPVVAMSAWGAVPDDLSWKYNPVRALTNEARSTLAKEKSDSVVGVYNTGLLSDKTALSELKQQTEETGMWSNITDEDIANADDVPQGQKMLEAGMGDMGGEGDEPAQKQLPKPKGKKAEDASPRYNTTKHNSKADAVATANAARSQGYNVGVYQVVIPGRPTLSNGWGGSATEKYYEVRAKDADTVDAAAKLTQLEAGYEYPATGKDQCVACTYFNAPYACDVVHGPVQSRGWCAEFEQKRTAQAVDENPDIERRISLPYGLTVYIENEEGSQRSGPWGSVIMRHPYGYIAGTAGVDGDAVDCFLGPAHKSALATVYIVHQGKPDPEDKLMIGFASARAAAEAYESNYNRDVSTTYTMDKMQLSDLRAKLVELKGHKLQ
jgi:phage-related protein (TIGR01555 family)